MAEKAGAPKPPQLGYTEGIAAKSLKSSRFFVAKEIAWRTPSRDQVGFQEDLGFFCWWVCLEIWEWRLVVDVFFFQDLPFADWRSFLNLFIQNNECNSYGSIFHRSTSPFSTMKASTGFETPNSSWCLCRLDLWSLASSLLGQWLTF